MRAREVQKLRGRVVRGAGEGRVLGYPTANLSRYYFRHHPVAAGVYAARVRLGRTTRPAAAIVGVDGKLELHLMDWRGQLYGRYLEAELVRRVRGLKRFRRAEDLIRQIRRDLVTIKRLLAAPVR